MPVDDIGQADRPSPGMTIKVYVVLQDSNVGHPSALLGVKLTKTAAEAIVARYPGARIEKTFADKN